MIDLKLTPAQVNLQLASIDAGVRSVATQLAQTGVGQNAAALRDAVEKLHALYENWMLLANAARAMPNGAAAGEASPDQRPLAAS